MTDSPATESLSVWIVNYESAGHVWKCLASLESSPVSSIVILDNASSSDDLAALARLADKYDHVTLILSQENLGFGGGHNRIAQETRGTSSDGIIWLLNPDTVVPAGTAELVLEAIKGNCSDIVSPVVLSGAAPTERIWFGGGEVDLRRGVVSDSALGRDPSILAKTPKLMASGFISGAAPMMTRATWDALGGFDASLFLYWEDVDLCLRAKQLGLRMAVRTDAPIWHAEGGSSKGTPGTREIVYFYTSRNRVTVCRRSRIHGWSLIVGPGTPALVRLVGQALVRGGKGRLKRVLAVLRGSIVGARTPLTAKRDIAPAPLP